MDKVFTDVMIDLETLCVKHTAKVISIGAVEFNVNTGHLGREFYCAVDRHTQAERTESQSTLNWWAKQSQEAQDAAFNAPDAGLLSSALNGLRRFIKPSQVVWGNGSTFDISILEDAYNFASPWKFFNVNDVRTVVRMAKVIGIDRPPMKVGTSHNALDDAIHQAKYTSTMWQALTKRRP